jgi:hypothetical protein
MTVENWLGIVCGLHVRVNDELVGILSNVEGFLKGGALIRG